MGRGCDGSGRGRECDNASQQGYYNQYGTVHGSYNTYGKSGSTQGTFSGSVVVSGYDPAAASAAMASANAQNAQMFSALEAQQSNRGAALETAIFRSQTIAPGQSYGGSLQVELPRKARRGSNHQIDVAIGDFATFTVFVDGSPTQAQLAALPKAGPAATSVAFAPEAQPIEEPELVAVSTPPVKASAVMTAQPQVIGAVRNMSRQKTTGKQSREYIFFDIEWTLSEPLAQLARIEGTVTLVDAQGRRRLQMPWYLERDPSLGRVFLEEGVGIELQSAGNAADWLRSVPADAIQIHYETKR